MFRLFIPLVFIALFILWILYHLVIKQDLKAQRNTLYIGVFFISIWIFIYYMILQ